MRATADSTGIRDGPERAVKLVAAGANWPRIADFYGHCWCRSMEKRTSMHGHWSSRTAFILAVTGSAVGLGNIWKFPYVAGENGGGAFVLVYLVCVVAIGLPIMMSEVLLGRRGRRNPITTMKVLGEEEAGQGWWQIVGWNGIIAGFRHSVVLQRHRRMVAGLHRAQHRRHLCQSVDEPTVSETFDDLLGSWPRMLFWHSAVHGHDDPGCRQGRSAGAGARGRSADAGAGHSADRAAFCQCTAGYVFGGPATSCLRRISPSWMRNTILVAMGQAFFSLSLGMGAVMAYGAYLPEGTSIGSTTLVVVFADTGYRLAGRRRDFSDRIQLWP